MASLIANVIKASSPRAARKGRTYGRTAPTPGPLVTTSPASEPEALLSVLKSPAYRFKRIGLEAGPLSQWSFDSA